VNVLTLGVQLFLTGRIVRRLGVGVTLAILSKYRKVVVIENRSRNRQMPSR
jgi:hypothetical protein